MLKNSIVVISGGAGLLGKQVATEVVQNGGKAVISDINTDAGESVVSEIRSTTGKDDVLFVKTDITSAESVQKTIAATHDHFGQIDSLVCSAYPRNAAYGRKLDDVTYEDFCENCNLHLGGYFLTAQQFCRYFKSQNQGNIIFMSSIYGAIAPRFEIYDNTEMTMPVEYAAIKAALQHLAKYFAKYYKGHGIRVNCVSPGGILDAQPDSFIAAYNQHGMSKGMLDGKDIMGAILFLLSNGSQYINGQTLVVDDGWTL